MRADDLTMIDFGRMFERLTLAYQRTVPSAQYEATVEVYFGAVRRFALPIVERAVTVMIEKPEGRYFPRAGDLAARCRTLLAEFERPSSDQHHADPEAEQLCSGCRTAFYFAGYELGNGNVVRRRRCRCRQAGVGWETEAAKTWVDPGPRSYAEEKAALRAMLDRPESSKRGEGGLRSIAGVIEPPVNAGDAWEAGVLAEKKATFRVAAQPEAALT